VLGDRLESARSAIQATSRQPDRKAAAVTGAGDQQRDFFIFYTGADRGWAE
jgi:hypothetical protein